MPDRTNSDKIEQLQAEVIRLTVGQDNFEEKFSIAIESLHEQYKRVEERLRTTERDVAVLQQRCNTLEKSADRHWQVWLALFSGLVAVIIAVFKK